MVFLRGTASEKKGYTSVGLGTIIVGKIIYGAHIKIVAFRPGLHIQQNAVLRTFRILIR